YLSESNNLAELRKRNAFDFDNIYCLNLGDEALEQYIKGVAARNYEISSSRQGGIAEINYFRLSLRLDEVISCDRQQALQEGDKILSSTYTQGSAICLYANIYTQWHSGIDNIIVEPINEDLRRVTIQTHYRGRYSSSPVVLVPDLAKIIAKRDISGFNRSLRCAFPHQSTAPRDEDILAKLGIEKNDVVFGFAGYFGDWLGDLGRQGAKVVYTDISPKIVKWVKRRNKGLFTEIRVGDPLKEPCQVNLYDWSFSYEPLPLEPNEWPIAMLRSLLNRKGLIMVASWGDTRGTKEQLRGFADIYGLKGRVDIEQGERLKVAGHAGEVHKGWVIIDARKRLMRIDFVSQQHCLAVIITTNEDLRAKAMQDILMIEALQSFKGRPLFELQSYLAEGNNAIDQQALLGSIERVTKLAMLIPEEFQIKIELDSSISSPVENAEIKSQPYRVVFSEQAEKDKEDLNEPLKIRLQNKVDLIKHNPRIGKSLHLYGYGCQFERFEKSAVIYYVDEPNQVIHMLRICRESEIKGKSVIKSIMKQLGDIRPKTTEGAKSSLASKLFNYGVISFEAQRIINTILSIKGVRLATQRNRIFFIFPSSIEKIKEQLNKTQSLRLKPDLERVGKFDLLDLGNDGREPSMIAKVGREDSGIALGLSNPNNPQALIIIRKLIRNVVVLTAGLLVLGGWFLNIPAAVGFAAASALAMGLAWQDEVAENGNGCSGAIPDILRSEGVLGIIKEELLSRVFLKYEDSKQDKKTYCNIRELSKKYGWKEHSRDKSAIIAKIKELLREKEEEIGFIIKDPFIKSPVELEKIESCIKKYVLAKMGVDREKDKEYQAWLMVYAFLILRGRRHNKEGIHSLKSESKMRRKRMKVENIAEVDDRLSSELKDIFSLDFIILLNSWIEEAKSNAKQKAAEKMSKVLVNRPIGAKRGFFAGEYYGDDDDDRVVQRYEASEQKRTEKTPSPAKFTLSSLYGFEIGDTVRHKALGIGRVVRLDGGMMFVWFKTVGEKQFQLSTAKQFFEILEGDDKESAATFASQPKNKIKRNLSVKRIEPSEKSEDPDGLSTLSIITPREKIADEKEEFAQTRLIQEPEETVKTAELYEEGEDLTEAEATTLGERMILLRKKNGLTKQDLSHISKVRMKSIVLLEQGKSEEVYPSTIRKISAVLEVNPIFLLTGKSRDEAFAQAKTAGERLFLLRMEAGLSPRQLKDKSGVDDGNIRLFEQGETNQAHPSTLKELSAALGVNPIFLLTGKSRDEALTQAKTAGERLFLLRMEVGLSPEQLGGKSGVNGQNIRFIEQEKIDQSHPSTLKELSAALGVNPIFLLTGKSRDEAFAQAKTAGERLFLLRMEAGLSLEQLGVKSGVNDGNIRSLEQGETNQVHPSTLKELSAALGVTRIFFITGKSLDEALADVKSEGEKAALLRKGFGISGERLSNISGITLSNIYNFESGYKVSQELRSKILRVVKKMELYLRLDEAEHKINSYENRKQEIGQMSQEEVNKNHILIQDEWANLHNAIIETKEQKDILEVEIEEFEQKYGRLVEVDAEERRALDKIAVSPEKAPGAELTPEAQEKTAAIAAATGQEAAKPSINTSLAPVLTMPQKEKSSITQEAAVEEAKEAMPSAPEKTKETTPQPAAEVIETPEQAEKKKNIPTLLSPSESETIGKRLLSEREKSGLSQGQLKAKSGASRKTISKLETGKFREFYPKTFKKLADALGTTVIILLTGKSLDKALVEEQTIGGRLVLLRKEAGLSQGQLAAKSGVSQKIIGRIETGSVKKPRPKTLKKLADALGTTRSEEH
ncbi:MAG: helix-turn-helix domain-containing protein, partial [Candidatus Omnitrophica bacterium]|nr:helix-turn-helix domain-containing protein [Candidatus Omnitrophota bacterium]